MNELCKLIQAFCVSHSAAVSSCMAPFFSATVCYSLRTQAKNERNLLTVVSSSVISTFSAPNNISSFVEQTSLNNFCEKVELFTLYCRKHWIINVNILFRRKWSSMHGGGVANIWICNVRIMRMLCVDVCLCAKEEYCVTFETKLLIAEVKWYPWNWRFTHSAIWSDAQNASNQRRKRRRKSNLINSLWQSVGSAFDRWSMNQNQIIKFTTVSNGQQQQQMN